MFIKPRKVKGIFYFYLVENKWVNGGSTRDFERCLGNYEKVDALFQQYFELKKRWIG